MLGGYSRRRFEAYRQSGIWLTNEIQTIFEECNLSWNQIEGLLEIGCGYGRHTRWLAQLMPAKMITVADVTKEAVDFCISEFGVKGIISDPEINWEQFEKYTVIYAFSLITHLSEQRVDNFFRLLNHCLRPGGVAIFTVHGPSTFARSDQIKPYLDPETIRYDVEKNGGIAFYRYAHYLDPDVGDTFVSEEYIKARIRELCANLEVLCIKESDSDRNDLWITKAAPIAGQLQAE